MVASQVTTDLAGLTIALGFLEPALQDLQGACAVKLLIRWPFGLAHEPSLDQAPDEERPTRRLPFVLPIFLHDRIGRHRKLLLFDSCGRGGTGGGARSSPLPAPLPATDPDRRPARAANSPPLAGGGRGGAAATGFSSFGAAGGRGCRSCRLGRPGICGGGRRLCGRDGTQKAAEGSGNMGLFRIIGHSSLVPCNFFADLRGGGLAFSKFCAMISG